MEGHGNYYVETAADKDVVDREHRRWTIMIYMAGDNNLSADMATSLRALSTVNPPGDGDNIGDTEHRNGDRVSNTSRNEVNLLAFFDSASLTAPTQYIDYSGRSPVTHDVTRQDLILPTDCDRRGGDPEDSASVRSILSFVQWSIKKRKATADNYILIFSGHSFGFSGTSFLRDQSTGRFLSLRRFRYALEEANRLFLFPDNVKLVSKNKEPRKIAIVGFDSCDMGMLEVGFELKEVANTVVASAGNVPNAGWGYAAMLRRFVEKNPDLFGLKRRKEASGGSDKASIGIVTPSQIKEAAKQFVYDYIRQQRDYAIGGTSVDMAAFDLDEINPLAKAVGGMGEILTEMLGWDCLIKDGKISKKRALIHNRTKDLLARSRMACQSYMHEQSVDIRDFCQRLMFGCREIRHESKELGDSKGYFAALQKQCKAIIGAADKFVLQSGFSGDEYQFSKGLSLYFPWTALTYLFTWSVYGNLRFCVGDYREVLSDDGVTFVKKKVAPGPGEPWDDFLLFYLYIVTLRPSETVPSFQDSYRRLERGSIIEGEWQQTRRNWLDTRSTRPQDTKPAPDKPWPQSTRENWRVGTRENWPVTGTRENWWVGTRENWSVGTRENWPVTGTRHNPLITGDRGLSGVDYMTFFVRIRNFVLNWEAGGFWPEAREEAKTKSSVPAKPVPKQKSAVRRK